jgi:hypothetical protein
MMNFPKVAPAKPSRKIKYRNMKIKNDIHNGSVINSPLFQRWSLALIIQTPFTILVVGKNIAQNIKKSITSAKNRLESPAYFLTFCRIESLYNK